MKNTIKSLKIKENFIKVVPQCLDLLVEEQKQVNN